MNKAQQRDGYEHGLFYSKRSYFLQSMANLTTAQNKSLILKHFCGLTIVQIHQKLCTHHLIHVNEYQMTVAACSIQTQRLKINLPVLALP